MRWREQEAEQLSAPISKRRQQSRESTLEVGCGHVISLPASWGVLAKPPQTSRDPTVQTPQLAGNFSHSSHHTLLTTRCSSQSWTCIMLSIEECLESFLQGMALALDSRGSCYGLCLRSPPEGFCVESVLMSPASLRS